MNRGKPLASTRILVTRPRPEAADFLRGLRRAGARALAAPLIRIAPPRSYSALDASLRTLARYDAAIFASRSAVEAFFARGRALGLGRLPRPPLLFAVGPKTAAALRERGWPAARFPQSHNGAALSRAMGRVKGLRVLLPRAQAGREELRTALIRRGARVSAVAAYRTLPDPSGLGALRRALQAGVDAVAFASPSAVDEFVSKVGPAACRRIFRRTAAASMGPSTSRALRAHGLTPALQARESTVEGLIAGLAAHFRSRP